MATEAQRRRAVGRRLVGWAAFGLVAGTSAPAGAAAAPFASPPPSEPPLVVAVQLLAPAGTELAGLEDLVAQRTGNSLSPAAVRRSVQLLDETGRFENVLAFTQPVDGGVALLLRLLPRRRLTALSFRGNLRFSDDDLRQKSALRSGDEFVESRLQAAALALGEAYQRAGYPSAQVTWQAVKSATQAAIEFQVAEGAPLRASAVALEGELGLPAEQLQAALGLEVGGVVDLEALDEGLRRIAKLYRAQGHFAAQVGPLAVERGQGERATVRLPLRAGPRFFFAFEGNRTFSDRQLRQVLDYQGEEPFEATVAQRLVERLRDRYRQQGFLLAKVALVEQRAPGAVREVFVIAEDLPYRVARLEFAGVDTLDAVALAREFRAEVVGDQRQPLFDRPESAEVDALGVSGRPAAPAPAEYRPEAGVYVPEVYAQAVARLTEHYGEEGFLTARVDPPRLDLDLRRRQLAVKIVVHEGARTYLRAETFLGAERLDQVTLRALTGLSLNEPLPRSGADRSRRTLLRGLAQNGLPFARVEVEQDLDPSGEVGSLRYRIHEGPEVHLGRILFRGNQRTADLFLRQNLGLQPGDRYDPRALQRSQQRLQQLGIFDQVQLGLLEPEVAEPTKDLLVTVHERRPQGVVVGGGFSLIEGPRAYIEYTHLNLLGRGLRFQSELRLNYFPWSYLALSNPTGSLVLEGLPPAQALTGQDNAFGFGGRLNAVLTDPRAFRWLGADGVTRNEALAERIDRPYYAFSRAALIPSVALVFDRQVTLGLQYDLEYDQINTYWANLDQVFSRLSFFDLTNLRFPNGQGISGALGPTFGYDRRDDPVNPHRGVAATVKSNWVYGTFSPAGSGSAVFGGALPSSGDLPIDLISASVNLSAYLPLGRSVLALSAKGGRIFPLGARSFVIPTQRFYLGGPDSDRGFQMDTLLPQDIRTGLHSDVGVCGQSASGVSCSTAAQILRGGNQLPSPGGEVFENLRAELRFPLYGLLDGALFVDAGNLWSDPKQFDPLSLRPASGAGVRLPTPIGPAAFDLGVNLAPDSVVNESLIQLFLSIGLF